MECLKNQKDITRYKELHVQETCPLCGRLMKYVESKNRVLDHDHSTGLVRDVVCRNCNSIEGKILNLCVRAGKHIDNRKFLSNLIEYWRYHATHPSGLLHPNFGKVIKRRKRAK